MSQLQVGNKKFEILDNVPEEYTALSDAISRIFYVCGSGKLCGGCTRHFNNVLREMYMSAKKERRLNMTPKKTTKKTLKSKATKKTKIVK